MSTSYSNLYNYNEKDLSNTLERIDDEIFFRNLGQIEVLGIIQDILKIDILSLTYTTRESLLNTLCNAVTHYKVNHLVNWNPIKTIRDKVENDLIEYIDQCLGA